MEAYLRRSPRSQGYWRGSRIQTLLFPAAAWSTRTARSWATRHGFRGDDVHVTEHYVRLRQSAPAPSRPKRTIELGRGIRAVVEAA